MAENVISQGLTLTWVQPITNATIQGYLVMFMERAGDQERMVNISEPVEMADITGLVPGVSYTFTVTAYNRTGESAPSDPLTVRTQDGGKSKLSHCPHRYYHRCNHSSNHMHMY